MPLALHHSDPVYEAEHALRVAVCALTRVDVDTITPGYARRFARLRTEVAVLAGELAGPSVTYQRGATIVHGRFIAQLSTDDTVAIRGSDGRVMELPAVGKFDLRRRSVVTRGAVAA